MFCKNNTHGLLDLGRDNNNMLLPRSSTSAYFPPLLLYKRLACNFHILNTLLLVWLCCPPYHLFAAILLASYGVSGAHDRQLRMVSSCRSCISKRRIYVCRKKVRNVSSKRADTSRSVWGQGGAIAVSISVTIALATYYHHYGYDITVTNTIYVTIPNTIVITSTNITGITVYLGSERGCKGGVTGYYVVVDRT